MKIDHILEKGSGRLNEDTLVIEDNLFGVFDGATSLEKTLFDQDRTGGWFASNIASDVFAKNGHSLRQLALHANNAIREKMITCNVDFNRRECLWSTSAAVARINENTLEWVQTGDAHILLINDDGNFNILADREDHDFQTLTLWKHLEKGPAVTISDTLIEQIIKTRTRMNRSYGVLNGEKEAENFIQCGVESLDSVKKILIFTDGLQIPSKTPGEKKHFDDLVHDYCCLGLYGLKKRIRAIEKTDPLCHTYPRFKCHDDIAAIAVEL